MLEILIVAACLETTEGCSQLSDYYFKHKGYDQIYDAFTKKYRRELELTSPVIFVADVVTNQSIKFKYRPFIFEIKKDVSKIGVVYDF